MKLKNNLLLTFSFVFGLLLLPLASSAQSLSGNNFGFNNFFFHPGQRQRESRVCSRSDNNPQTAACDAHVVTDAQGNAKNFITPSGYGPSQLAAAYGLTTSVTAKKIIGIVDAYDDPYIQSDLNTYSLEYGIPVLSACKASAAASATPCLQKSDENGSTHYPAQNSGWDLEISLDVEAMHALCQNCSIVLVEARSSSYADLLSSVDRAITLGASVVSNSWGGGEFPGETAYDLYLNKPGVALTFSSGDSGYGVEYPAASKYVTAVGGTSLTMNGLTYGGETAWSGGGSGCSAYETKPAWQTDTGCGKRTVADVAADADPNTGAAVYDTVRYDGVSGWFQVGGTSLASPIVAATYAESPSTAGSASQLPYLNATPNNLHDVTSGSNGSCLASVKYLCTAGLGYDGPTGLGSPNGSSAF